MLHVPALTVRPPWSEWIADGIKTVENRTWSTNYRGPLVIHAGSNADRRGFRWGSLAGSPIGPHDCFKKAFIAVVELVDCHYAGTGCGPDCGEASQPDVYHWLLWGAYRIEPVPGPGKQYLFAPPFEVHAQIDVP